MNYLASLVGGHQVDFLVEQVKNPRELITFYGDGNNGKTLLAKALKEVNPNLNIYDDEFNGNPSLPAIYCTNIPPEGKHFHFNNHFQDPNFIVDINELKALLD